MRSQYKSILPVLIIILLVTIACNISAGGPQPTLHQIPVSVESAESLERTLKNALEADPAAETIAVTLSEEQVTSYLAIRLGNQQAPLLRNPQVYLQDGKIELYGEFQQTVFSVNARLTILPIVDDTGKISFDISAADFGAFPAPENLLDTLSAALNETLTGSLAPTITGIRIQSVYIANGMMTISGIRQ